jgi:hypothetical protein
MTALYRVDRQADALDDVPARRAVSSSTSSESNQVHACASWSR